MITAIAVFVCCPFYFHLNDQLDETKEEGV